MPASTFKGLSPKSNLLMRCDSRPRGHIGSAMMTTNDFSAVQQLWNLAHATFNPSTGLPSPRQVDALRAAFAAVSLEDLGIDAQSPDNPAKITYLHIQEDSQVSLGIFCLPAGAHIPLHDHPGMTVLSRVLYGSMHVKSYDWTNHDSGEAAPVLNRAVSPDDGPLALFPEAGGNIHSFTALTPCAVLDLLTPPYQAKDGRDCTYYRESESGAGNGAKTVRLEVYEPPGGFIIESGTYRGQKVT